MRRSVGLAVAGLGIFTMSFAGFAMPATAESATSTPSPSAAAVEESEKEPEKEPEKGTEKGTDAKGEQEGTGETKEEAHAHDAAALVKASAALTKAEAELARAQKKLDDARGDLAEAREADINAQAELEAAVLAHQRAVRETVENRRRLEEHRTNLGQLARAAYQSNGPMGQLSLVLESETPKQMTDRMAMVQSIASAGNAVVSELEDARADLENAKARLAAAREEQEDRREAAAAALAAIEAKASAAELAEQQVSMVVILRKLALQAALEAKKFDLAQYQNMRVQSGRLGTRIAELGAQVDAGKNKPKPTGEFSRPGTGATTSPYGPRLHPILRYVKVHTGMDFGVGDGFTYAADNGVVIITEPNVAYGNMTIVYHGKVAGLPTATMYAHQAAFGVEPGDVVRKGQVLGLIGSTGYSTGPHLHFEVLLGGRQVDPAPFLEDAPLPSSTS